MFRKFVSTNTDFKKDLFKIFLSALLLSLTPPLSGFAQETQRRIVSLAPSATEWIDAFGLVKSLVGVTEQCDYPAAVRTFDKVGSFMRTDIERVLMKRPTDVVAVDGFPANLERRLTAQGIRVHVLKIRNLSDFPDEILKLGAALGAAEKAKAWSAKLRDAFVAPDPRVAETNAKKMHKKVLLVVSLQPIYIASGYAWLSQFFERSGLKNAAGELGQQRPGGQDFIQISLEMAIESRVDQWIVFADAPELAGELRSRAEKILSRRRGRLMPEIRVLPADIFIRPGPRLLEAQRLIGGSPR